MEDGREHKEDTVCEREREAASARWSVQELWESVLESRKRIRVSGTTELNCRQAKTDRRRGRGERGRERKEQGGEPTAMART